GNLLLLNHAASSSTSRLSLWANLSNLRYRRTVDDSIFYPSEGKSLPFLRRSCFGDECLGVLCRLAAGSHHSCEVLGLFSISIQSQGADLPLGRTGMGRLVLCGDLLDSPTH